VQTFKSHQSAVLCVIPSRPYRVQPLLTLLCVQAADEEADLEAAIAASLSRAAGIGAKGEWKAQHPPCTNADYSDGKSFAQDSQEARPAADASLEEAGTRGVRPEAVTQPDSDLGKRDAHIHILDDSAGVCEIAVKLPTNKRIIGHFGLAQKLQDVMSWLGSLGWDMHKHQLSTSCPRRALVNTEQSLLANGIQGPRELLVLETA
jgi:hypothetical protein